MKFDINRVWKGCGKTNRVLLRMLVLLCVALLVAGTVNPMQVHGMPRGVTPSAATNLRTGMTWAAVEQQDGYVHIGSDGQTNPYAGDTTIDQSLPVLCVLIDDRTAPSGISFDYYNGWVRGAIQATPAIQGAALTSQQQGDAICANTFGAGWRMAEFHDGWYGPDFSASGGWSYWGAGQLTAGTRFWVAINDQPANPWNSAGEVPPLDDDAVLKTRLQELMHPLLTLSQNPRFRDLVYTDVARRFDGDDNVLLSDLLREAEQAQIVDPSSPSWQSLTAQVAGFQNVNGNAYYPQIYIPNFQDGAVPDADVTMVVYETDVNRTQLPAYQLDPNGDLHLKDQPVDETYAEAHEVWVLSVNERIDMTPDELATVRALDAMGATSRKPQAEASRKPQAGTTTAQATASTPQATMSTDQSRVTGVACNPTGLRNNKGMEYLQSFRIPNPSSVEPWTRGKLEPRVVIVGKDGVEIGNKFFGKIKHKTVKNGYNTDLFLTTWDRAVWGDYLAYKWIEIDNGPKIELSLGLSGVIRQLLNVNFDVKAIFEKKFDDMGSGVVGFSEGTYMEYGTGIVYWRVCSVGGEGGTGNDNLALSALAAASSSFPGYSPARVNDGSQNTTVGGAFSWANADRYAPNGFLPQWVQLDFGTNKTFSKVVVYTSAGYPIQDFDIQVWNGLNWVTLTPLSSGQVRGNTALRIERTFTPRTARLVRIFGIRGPINQPQYVRVNEFEVYQ